jgi:MerR family redox-sensitive transcriptional activator SoxR
VPLQADLKSRISIGELARQAGIRASAIRYYESIGLLPRPERASGRRVYRQDTLERLRRIQLAQESGFQLGEIRSLEKGLDKEGPKPESWRRLAASKLKEVDEQICRLMDLRALLHETLKCECSSLGSCPLLERARSARAR